MFRMVGYGENIGSGFPLILDDWKQSGWGEPKLENKIDLDEVELDLPLKKITRDDSDESKEKNHLDVEKSNEKGREKSKEKIISIIRDNPKVTQFELSNILNVSEKAIEKHIKNYEKLASFAGLGQTKAGIGRLSKKTPRLDKHREDIA